MNTKRGNTVGDEGKDGFGGWGDYRDRQMCLAIANRTISEQTIKNLQF